MPEIPGLSVRLTALSSCAGCAAKLSPDMLTRVLHQLSPILENQHDPNMLVGLDAPDDAVVYRLSEERALIVTTDFFTPIVDDPYTYGAIAATNALSDVYAMGGEALFALNIAALPENLPFEIVTEILRGGATQVRAAGALVAGGHTIKNNEPVYGLAVVGEVHPERMFRKTGAQVGDRLFLTKPLGTGLITTALKRDQAEASHVNAATASMMTLNRAAAQAARAANVTCATDVTGFGLLGHANEMAAGSDGALEFSFSALPLLPGARHYADANLAPGGTHSNRAFYGPRTELAPELSDADALILFDPQTSGGLLIAVPELQKENFVQACEKLAQPTWEIGRVVEGSGVHVIL